MKNLQWPLHCIPHIKSAGRFPMPASNSGREYLLHDRVAQETGRATLRDNACQRGSWKPAPALLALPSRYRSRGESEKKQLNHEHREEHEEKRW